MLVEQSSDQYDTLSKLKSSANLGASWRYELILVDAAMASVNLIQVVESAREIMHMRDVPVLAVNTPYEDIEGLERFGIDCLSATAPNKDIKLRLRRIFDVEQVSVSSTSPDEIPVPRLPDDHLNWLDKQGGEVSPGYQESLERDSRAQLAGRVLVVEDNPVNQAVVKKMLEKSGLSPVTANDGLEAIEVLRGEQFDVVLMDCQMPRMDGYEATEAIRDREKKQALKRTPIIAMTANAMSGDRERCLACGMDDYLSKPVKPAQLENMLRQWLPMEGMIQTTSPVNLDETESETELATDVGLTSETFLNVGDSSMTVSGIIDRNVLEELYEIMEDDFVSVLESYLKSAPGLMQGIRDAVKSVDMDGLVKSAHPLKSSSANVGAMELSILARELEFKGRQNDTNGLVDSYNRTAEVYRRSVSELKAIIEKGHFH
jgi:CheY-like chemotaxis protein/HPt (histidine-containing phosphotransfer) domain-containing protein